MVEYRWNSTPSWQHRSEIAELVFSRERIM